MNSEISKYETTLPTFLAFLSRCSPDLRINLDSIRMGIADRYEPDIVCNDTDGKLVGFELTEACSQDSRAITAKLAKSGGVFAGWIDTPGDNIERVVSKKITKTYNFNGDLNLLVYTEEEGRDEYLIECILYVVGEEGTGLFSRIWFHSDKKTMPLILNKI